MTCRRNIRLVPRRDNVVDLHEFRRKHARKVLESAGLMLLIERGNPQADLIRHDGGDPMANTYPADCEPTGDDAA